MDTKKTNIETTIQNISQVLEDAIAEFKKQDGELLEIGAHEQSISHRLAVHLESKLQREKNEEMKKLSVDCEYNRSKTDSKRKFLISNTKFKEEIKISEIKSFKPNSETLKKYSETLTKDKSLFRPDIILHQRTKDTDNILVVEIKHNLKFSAFENIEKFKEIIFKESYSSLDQELAINEKIDILYDLLKLRECKDNYKYEKAYLLLLSNKGHLLIEIDELV